MATGQAVERDASSEIAILARLTNVDGSDLPLGLVRFILTQV
jgi:hypothetical protein